MLEISGLIMDNTIDIYPAIAGQDIDGGMAYTYSNTPAQIGVPCSCQPRDVEQVIDEQNRITELLNYHVFFNFNPGIKPRDKLQFVDGFNVTHLLFVGATRDEGGAGAYFVVRAVERL